DLALCNTELNPFTNMSCPTFGGQYTFQEVDVRLRKSFMLNDEIKLYQYGSKVLSGNWEFHGSGENEEGADLFKYPDYRYNNLIDIDKKSHIDVYLFTNKEN
ncbi:exotoxin beta-grasp domain-containing protein, partial [Streptococcus equi]|uniref:exotoxin beta-grasp domain-containing protein n=1 Tax=Streptococcus equi TaxID=1336 RepID=UPI000A68F98C